MKILKNKKGFTLVELLGVLGILAVLMAMVVPKISGFTNEAKVSSDNVAQQTIEKALLMPLLNGEINVHGNEATIEIKKDGTYTSNSLYKGDSAISDADLKIMLDELLGEKIKPQSKDIEYFKVIISKNNDIHVYTDKTEPKKAS